MAQIIVNKEQYYLDGYLKENLDLIKKKIFKDWDFVIIIDGIEGVGKSTLARQIGYYLDPTMTMDNIKMSAEDYIKAVEENKQKYKCIIFDEAGEGLDSKAALTTLNRRICNLLRTRRHKNLFHIIVLPSFFELVSYAAIHRSRALINVHTEDNLTRGYFRFFEISKKRQLYVYGKKELNHKKVRPTFKGWFNSKFNPKWFDKKIYIQMKEESNKIYEKQQPKYLEERNKAIYGMYEQGVPVETISQIMGKSGRTIYDAIKAAKEAQKI